MNAADLIRLRHMADAAREALEFAEDRTRGDLDSNLMLLRALIKDIEIVGEAATNVSAESRRDAPTIPWQAIVTMRNRLIHGYFDVDRDIVWSTVTADLPALLAELKKILPASP
jgi:uncharacterized protein with HEPN domain